MTALRAIDGTPPAIQPHQARWGTLETWGELEAWLTGRVQHFDVYLSDGETAQSVGYDGQKKAEGRIAAYREVLERIAPLAAAERAERAETAAVESIEQRFKDAYGDGPDGVMAQIQAEDR